MVTFYFLSYLFDLFKSFANGVYHISLEIEKDNQKKEEKKGRKIKRVPTLRPVSCSKSQYVPVPPISFSKIATMA